MKHVLLVCSVAFVACGVSPGDPVVPATVPPNLRVATYNLYLGADLEGVLGGTGAQVTPATVSQLFDAVVATDPSARMDQVAALLAVEAPEVVALQEAMLWRTQATADGPATPAGEVAYDFVQLVLDGLAARGLDYRVAAIQDNADVEAPDASGRDVRLTDRDAILVRAGLSISDPQKEHFEVNLEIPTNLGTVRVLRGWVSTNVTVNGRTLRVVNTHLEAAAAPIRDAQAAELLVDTAGDEELLVAGDFNFTPDEFVFDSFDLAELDDAGDAGPTCCQAIDVRNPQSTLFERIDMVFERGAPSPRGVRRIGADPSQRTASGLWPSDHAGYVADFAIE